MEIYVPQKLKVIWGFSFLCSFYLPVLLEVIDEVQKDSVPQCKYLANYIKALKTKQPTKKKKTHIESSCN